MTITRNWDGSIPYVPVPANLSSVSGGGGVQSIAPNLTTPYTSQYTAGVQAGWHKDYLVGFTAVRTFDYGGADKLNQSLPFSAYTLESCIPDPGRNNVGFGGTGPIVSGQNPTGNQVCAWAVPKTYPNYSVTNNLYTNYAKGEGTKNYSAFESTFQKQHSHGWSMLFGYTRDFAHVNTANQNLFSPNSLVYNWSLPQWNQEIKVNGGYDLPHGIKYSSTYQVQSGAYFGRYVNITSPTGATLNVEVEQQAGRYPYVKLWDNRISKLFKVGDRNTFEAMFDLYNTLNANTVLSQVTTNSTTFGATCGGFRRRIGTSATSILPARIFKLGMRWRV